MKISRNLLVALGLLIIPIIVTLIFLFYLSQPAQAPLPALVPAVLAQAAMR